MKKINKYYLILIILILYSFIQFFEWFQYSTLISNFINKKNEIKKNEVKKENLVNILKKRNQISIEQYEKRFGEIFDYLPNKNEELGYITDYNDQKDVGLEYMFTQYVLSPHIIKLSSDKKYLIGNFSKKIIEKNIIEDNKYIFCEKSVFWGGGTSMWGRAHLFTSPPTSHALTDAFKPWFFRWMCGRTDWCALWKMHGWFRSRLGRSSVLREL